MRKSIFIILALFIALCLLIPITATAQNQGQGQGQTQGQSTQVGVNNQGSSANNSFSYRSESVYNDSSKNFGLANGMQPPLANLMNAFFRPLNNFNFLRAERVLYFISTFNVAQLKSQLAQKNPDIESDNFIFKPSPGKNIQKITVIMKPPSREKIRENMTSVGNFTSWANEEKILSTSVLARMLVNAAEGGCNLVVIVSQGGKEKVVAQSLAISLGVTWFEIGPSNVGTGGAGIGWAKGNVHMELFPYIAGQGIFYPANMQSFVDEVDRVAFPRVPERKDNPGKATSTSQEWESTREGK